MSRLIFLFAFLLGSLYVCNAHPIPTFWMNMCDSTGKAYDYQWTAGNYTSGQQETLYFYFTDMEHNNAIVPFGLMMPMHQRFIHVLIVSQDNELTGHTHPDDFTDMSKLPNDTTVFSINITFPRAGIYSIAANFMFNDLVNKTYRDGFAQTEFNVIGAGKMNPNPTRNFNTTNRYALWNFTDASREIFEGWVDTTKNYDPKGYWGELLVSIDNGPLTSAQNINLTALNCTYFVVNMYSDNDTMGEPAPLLPLMAAPVHFTLTNYDGAVYHSHGMYLPSNMSFTTALKTLGKLTMGQLMMMDPLTDYRYNLSQSASMIGITPDGLMDCMADEGKVMYDMDKMGMMMDMSQFYGPSKFNNMASIFNFPNGFNWRVYAWMKVQDHEGNPRLLVPHWDISVVDRTPIPTDTITYFDQPSSASAIAMSIALAMLALIV
eukprot:TRINITY_DN4600_c0_g1_i1.p1 TRINITY_DN4600_c0_g1~~TRINITY_DN4600_c0_g1_i1.p1  ORF type:complete len:433 (-),score=93.62 TRINITY_DN4600_c0_g1_i1:105-1403(-)